jgi:hypothetical protein
LGELIFSPKYKKTHKYVTFISFGMFNLLFVLKDMENERKTSFMKYTLEKTKGAIMNVQSRETGNT